MKTKVVLHSKQGTIKNYKNMWVIIVETWQPPKTLCLSQGVPLAFDFIGSKQTSGDGDDVINLPFISLVNINVSVFNSALKKLLRGSVLKKCVSCFVFGHE